MKSLQEKIDKIESLWLAGDDYEKQIFEWVKTGVLSLSEFREALALVSQLHEDESRKLWG